MADRITALNSLDSIAPGSAGDWRTIATSTDQLVDIRRAARLKEWWKYSSLPQYAQSVAESLQTSSDSLLECHASSGILINALELLPDSDQRALSRFWADPERLNPYPLAESLIRSTADGWYVRITEELDAPLYIEQGTGSDVIFIDVEPGAKLQLISRAQAEEFNCSVLMLRIGQGASVEHALFSGANNANGWHLCYAQLAGAANYDNHSHLICQSRQRYETHIALVGDGSNTTVEYAAVGFKKAKLDQQLRIEHIGCHTRSRETVHLLGKDNAVMTFNGRIHIHPDAMGSDAALTNKNVALSDSVRFNTKPELEIYNNEVRCSHGATLGQLDPEALFLLQSRGLDPVAARRLLCSAFLSTAISGPLADTVRDAVKAQFQ